MTKPPEGLQNLKQGDFSGYLDWVQDWAADGEGSMDLLIAPPNVVPSKVILRIPIQRTPMGHPWITSTPQHLQHGGGRHDLALDYTGSGGGGGI